MRTSWRLPVAVVSAVVVAEAAVLRMRPRDRGPDPRPVESRAYFSAAQIERARAFRAGQRRIALAQSAIGLGVLAALARRPPRLGRTVPAGAAAGAAISLATGAAALPLSALARERAKRVGLVTQGAGGWLGDVAKAQAIGAAFAGLGGAALAAGMDRFGRRWWLPGAAAVVGFGVLATYAGPVALDPLFNRFEPLAPGALRSDVLDLARRAGVDVGEVYEVDASRRTTAANAYVNGLGRTKRVVLFDTLIKDFTPAETRLVVAHELGHVAHRDVRDALLWLAVVAPAGMWAAAVLAEELGGGPEEGAGAVPRVALALALVAPALSIVSSQLSRAVERRADAFSLRLTGDPRTFIAFQQRIALQNVAEPQPPALARRLLGTHPSTLERIGAAEAFAG